MTRTLPPAFGLHYVRRDKAIALLFVALALVACAARQAVAEPTPEDVRALFAQAADAAGLSLEELVDATIISEDGSSAFYIDGGRRIVRISREDFQTNLPKQMLVAIHELVHAAQFARFINATGFDDKELAVEEWNRETALAKAALKKLDRRETCSVEELEAAIRYAANEQEAERTALGAVKEYFRDDANKSDWIVEWLENEVNEQLEIYRELEARAIAQYNQFHNAPLTAESLVAETASAADVSLSSLVDEITSSASRTHSGFGLVYDSTNQKWKRQIVITDNDLKKPLPDAFMVAAHELQHAVQFEALVKLYGCQVDAIDHWKREHELANSVKVSAGEALSPEEISAAVAYARHEQDAERKALELVQKRFPEDDRLRILKEKATKYIQHWREIEAKAKKAKIARGKPSPEDGSDAAHATVHEQSFERDQKLLESAFNDFQGGKISEEQLKQIVRNCNSRHSQYHWKYEKRLVREYTQGDYVIREYEIRISPEELE